MAQEKKKVVKKNEAKIDHLGFWNSVMTTDPKHTKEVGFGRKFTSINAQYQLQEMTRAFGRIGEGWGIEAESFNVIIDNLLSYQATLWYTDGGKNYSFPINSSIQIVTNKGKLDDEIYKKVSTDALTKGLSKLGFNADIFLGLWDDNRYVSQLREAATPNSIASVKETPTLTDIKFKAMLKAIEGGKGDVVKAKMKDYMMSEVQTSAINAALTLGQ
jgi:hypothetical protein